MARIFSDGGAIADDALRAIFDGGGGQSGGWRGGASVGGCESWRAPPAAHTLLPPLLPLPGLNTAAATTVSVLCQC